jgi:hypothetical protein
MAHGRLALFQSAAHISHVELACLREREQQAESGFIREKLEDLGQVADDLVRNRSLDRGCVILGILDPGRGTKQTSLRLLLSY